MPSEKILSLLTFYKNKNNLQISDNVLESFAQHVTEISLTRPIPDAEAVKNSEKAANIFKNLMLRLETGEKKSTEKHLFLENLMVNLDVASLKENEELLVILNFSQKSRLKRCTSLEDLRTLIAEVKEKAGIDYHAIFNMETRNSLTACSLEIHSSVCKKSLESNEGSAQFIHFYESTKNTEGFSGKPRAAEYLQGYDSEDEEFPKISFNKTSHGIGSGIYGLAGLSREVIDAQILRSSQFRIVKIQKPLRLSENESEQYTSISKGLQEIGDLVKDKQSKTRKEGAKLSRNDTLTLIAKEKNDFLMKYSTEINSFSAVKSKNFTDEKIYKILYSSMKNFLEAARSKNSKENIVPMPINYLVGNLGFTGVVSKINDSFSRGLIAMDEDELGGVIKISVKTLSAPSNKKEKSWPEEEQDSEEILTSNTPLPSATTLNGGNAFFAQVQPPKDKDSVAQTKHTGKPLG